MDCAGLTSIEYQESAWVLRARSASSDPPTRAAKRYDKNIDCDEAAVNATSAANATCMTCPAGKFASSKGASTCLICPSGTYSGVAGASTCTSRSCPAGTTSEAQKANCTVCPAGTYSTKTEAWYQSCVCRRGERHCHPFNHSEKEGASSWWSCISSTVNNGSCSSDEMSKFDECVADYENLPNSGSDVDCEHLILRAECAPQCWCTSEHKADLEAAMKMIEKCSGVVCGFSIMPIDWVFVAFCILFDVWTWKFLIENFQLSLTFAMLALISSVGWCWQALSHKVFL